MITPPRNWRDQAACRDHEDPELWFADRDFRPRRREAKRVCWFCPVRTDCLRHALAVPETWGIWGGYEPEERNRMLARARRRAELAPGPERRRPSSPASATTRRAAAVTAAWDALESGVVLQGAERRALVARVEMPDATMRELAAGFGVTVRAYSRWLRSALQRVRAERGSPGSSRAS